MKKSIVIAIALFCSAMANAEEKTESVKFEDFTPPTGQTYNNNSGTAGYFQSGSFRFSNNYDATFGSWDGFAFSQNTGNGYSGDYTDDTQYNSCVGHGADNSKTYAVAYISTYFGRFPVITNADGKEFTPQSMELTNAAYAFKVIREGNGFSRQFTESDWFTLTITGKKGGVVTKSITVDLAKDAMMLYTWKKIDLTPLGTVDQITFNEESSDSDPTYGINTPAYFCMDNFVAKVTDTPTSAKVVMSKTVTDSTVVGIFNPDGTQKSALTQGPNIVKYSDGSFQKIYK